MTSGVLERLVNNSRAAIADGTYDVTVQLQGSDVDLARAIPANPRPTLITEVKFSSPSQGKIKTPSDPAAIARQMVAGGASALSVLTQPHLFGGSPEYFARARQAVRVPMLMKDVVVDTVQIDAAKRLGADYILLIRSLFDQGYLKGMGGFVEYAHKMGLGVLVEAHTKPEFMDALESGADIVGVNNRNLDTLEVDLKTTGDILGGYGGDVPIVSESGIGTAGDIRYLKGCGASAFLVGSSVMRSDDIEGHVRGLVGAY